MGGKSSKSTTDKNTLDIAITGVAGAGKSSLVNALRGMTDYEEGAAVVGVIEMTMEPKGYPHPTFPEVKIWDLPGTGTPKFNLAEYFEQVHFSKYDVFIIIATDRFTEDEARLACEIHKMNKKFYYIRSKIDCSLDSERRKRNFCEDKILQRIRDDCCGYLTKMTGLSSPKVFLICRHNLDKYDFPLLQHTLQNEIYTPWRPASMPAVPQNQEKKTSNLLRAAMEKTITKALLKKEIGELKELLEEREISFAATEIQREMDLLENATLNIAITGRAGAGKSSLVNALREMEDDDEDAAETGVTQITMERKGYQHPSFPKVTFWDLPGIGTCEFPAKNYLKQVNFTEYDFFIIVAGERFTENDVKLASEIKKMNKKFYYVCTKVDISIENEKKRRNFSEEETLEKMRNYCCENLRRAGEPSPRVFLISRWDLSMYDFPLLQKTSEEGLDEIKKHVLIMSMPTFSRDMLEKKKAEMKKLIWKLAFLSCALGAIPVPGLSLACDIPILVGTVNRFYKIFGMDEASLQRLANRVGKPLGELKSAITRTLHAGEFKREFIISCLTRSAICAAMTVLELVLDFIPVLSSLTGGALSFATTFYLLSTFLEDVVKDAESVRAKAAEH